MAGNKFKKFMEQTGAGLLSEASKNVDVEDTMEIVYVPRNQIVKNPKNKYSISNIRELADLIALMGIREPLGIRPEGDHYILVEGERRITAIDLLIKEGKWGPDQDIPCIIRKRFSIDVDAELTPDELEVLEISGTNAGQRKYSEADYLYEVENLEPIYKKLKKAGIGVFEYTSPNGEKVTQVIEGKKTRELLAEKLNVSPAQAGKISKVVNKGTDELKNAIKEGTVNLSVAGEMASLSKEDQNTIIEQHKENLPEKPITQAEVATFKFKNENVQLGKTKKAEDEKQDPYTIDDKEFMKLTKKLRKKLKDSPKKFEPDEYFKVISKIKAIEDIFS